MAEAATTAMVQAVDDKKEADFADSDLKAHPLLQEDVLDKIFPYFTNAKNLHSFRLVCPTWSTSAGRTVKKNLRWRIGPTLHSEKKFMKVMSKCTDDVFGNFLWTHDKPPYMKSRAFGTRRRRPLGENWHKHVEAFLQTFGAQIVNLRLRAADPAFVQRRLQSSYLPNLEHLELYDISEAAMRAESFEQIHYFPKLKSICLTPKKFHNEKEMRRFKNGVGRSGYFYNNGFICDKILGAAPKLKHMEVNIHAINRRLLVEQNATNLSRLANLTSFKTAPPTSQKISPHVAIQRSEFENLLERCPQLKRLCLTFDQDELEENDICEILARSNIGTYLQELNFTIRDEWSTVDFVGVFEDNNSDMDSSDDDEDGFVDFLASPELGSASPSLTGSEDEMEFDAQDVNAERKQKPVYLTLPEMPELKKLTLHLWRLHDFEIFYNKPNLVYVDLLLNDSYSLIRPTAHISSENVNVKYLKWRDKDQVGLNGLGIELFAAVFPNLEELDVKMGNDEYLEAIFTRMPQLKRLNLSDSPITDSGMTGMEKTKLKEASEKSLTLEQVSSGDWRQKPFIGDLKELQQFTYTGLTLTNLSIHYGIAALKNLTNLKFKTRHHNEWASDKWDEEDSYSQENPTKSNEPVDIRPLLTNCKRLVRLDVNRTLSDDESDHYNNDSDSDCEEELPTKPEYDGCGLNLDDINFVKETYPHLELVYGEKWPPS